MHEIKANIHIHTKFSDGSKTHAEIAREAIACGLDVICITDHNVLMKGFWGYYASEKGKVLVIPGEEIHDRSAFPQKHHLLSIGVNNSFVDLGDQRQILIDEIDKNKGLSIIAHPFDPALPAFGETDISWDDWSVKNFNGIEIWNGFSELKVRAQSLLRVLFFVFFPVFLPLQPQEKTIRLWDTMLNNGNKIFAFGGSDAHSIPYHYGLLKKKVFPYHFHFKSINNYIRLKSSLSGNADEDISSVISAFKYGNFFIANDQVGKANGFTFQVKTPTEIVQMGESHPIQIDMDLTVAIPRQGRIKLFHNGNLIITQQKCRELKHRISEKGVYRVECKKWFWGKQRTWIVSNPIFIT